MNIVILDMASRIAFLFQARQTVRWLEEYRATPHESDHLVLHYPRFNIVGFSTPQNLNALFAACPPLHELEEHYLSWQRPDCGEPLASISAMPNCVVL